MAKISAFVFMLALAGGAQCVFCTPSKYSDQDVSGYDESASEALGDVLVGERPNLLLTDSASSWIKNCVCSILSTGGCGLFMEKTEISEVLNKNPKWNDLSFVLQEMEESAKYNEPEHDSKSTADTPLLSEIELIAYLGNIFKKCFHGPN